MTGAGNAEIDTAAVGGSVAGYCRAGHGYVSCRAAGKTFSDACREKTAATLGGRVAGNGAAVNGQEGGAVSAAVQGRHNAATIHVRLVTGDLGAAQVQGRHAEALVACGREDAAAITAELTCQIGKPGGIAADGATGNGYQGLTDAEAIIAKQ